jgi:hypothetical protein
MVDNVINVKKFCCSPCKYYSDYSGNIKQHMKTKKHIHVIKEQEGQTETKTENVIELKCPKCAKIYKTQSGIWKHSKNCNFIPVVVAETPIIENIVVDDTTTESANVEELILIEIKKINESNFELKETFKNLKKAVEDLRVEVQSIQFVPSNVNNITNVTNNNININLFMNEVSNNSIDMVMVVKQIMNALNNSKMMIGNDIEVNLLLDGNKYDTSS